MAKTMLLTLDLDGHVPEESRQKVYAKLAELHWAKIQHVDTAWRCSYQQPTTESSAIAEAQRDVATAAASGNVTRYFAVVLAGESQPTEFHS
jgi:hypothetical protein